MTQPWSARQAGTVGLPGRSEPANLADILERVLDKGIVIAGDIRVNLLDIELLTIRLRLLIASVDRAREMGIDWWEHDPTLSSGQRDLAEENRSLRRRLGELEIEAGRRSDASDSADEAEGASSKNDSGPARQKRDDHD
jgi:Gas vesicle protein